MGPRGSAPELLNRDCAERDHGLAVSVDLEADEAVPLHAGLGLGEVGGLLAVEEDPDPRALAADFVAVPVAGLLEALDLLGVGLGELAVPAGLVMVVFEERELVGRFGEDYRTYQREVPRFIPRWRRLR